MIRLDKNKVEKSESDVENVNENRESLPYLGFLLNEAATIIRHRTTRALEPFGLNPRLFGVLETVGRQQAISQRGLGEVRNTDRTTVVAQIDELEKMNLIERRTNPEDRRGYCLFLTEKGDAILKKANEAAREVEIKFLEDLPSEDCEELLKILWQMFLKRNPNAKFHHPEEIESLCTNEKVM